MSFEWLIGLSVMFGFGLFLSIVNGFSLENFFGYSCFMNAFMVYADFLPLWSLILMSLIMLFIVVFEFKRGSMEI